MKVTVGKRLKFFFSGLSRNKILGELEAEENRDVEESEPVTKRPNQPQYVNIRRQRPTTTEATSTSSRYTSLRRSTASPVDLEDETELNEPRYVLLLALQWKLLWCVNL